MAGEGRVSPLTLRKFIQLTIQARGSLEQMIGELTTLPNKENQSPDQQIICQSFSCVPGKKKKKTEFDTIQKQRRWRWRANSVDKVLVIHA